MRIEPAGDTLRIFEVKELDATTATSFQDLIEEALTERIRHIEIDLSGTVCLDSCGLGALAALRRFLDGQGGAVRLLDAAPPVQQMLELTRLCRLLEVVRREEIAATQD